MFDFRDLFQWERFITPSIIKIFYWLAAAVSVLAGLSGVFSGLRLMLLDPISGLFFILASLIGLFIGSFGQGQLSDRLGRRAIYQFNLLLFGVFTILGALLGFGGTMYSVIRELTKADEDGR